MILGPVFMLPRRTVSGLKGWTLGSGDRVDFRFKWQNGFWIQVKGWTLDSGEGWTLDSGKGVDFGFR